MDLDSPNYIYPASWYCKFASNAFKLSLHFKRKEQNICYYAEPVFQVTLKAIKTMAKVHLHFKRLRITQYNQAFYLQVVPKSCT